MRDRAQIGAAARQLAAVAPRAAFVGERSAETAGSGRRKAAPFGSAAIGRNHRTHAIRPGKRVVLVGMSARMWRRTTLIAVIVAFASGPAGASSFTLETSAFLNGGNMPRSRCRRRRCVRRPQPLAPVALHRVPLGCTQFRSRGIRSGCRPRTGFHALGRVRYRASTTRRCRRVSVRRASPAFTGGTNDAGTLLYFGPCPPPAIRRIITFSPRTRSTSRPEQLPPGSDACGVSARGGGAHAGAGANHRPLLALTISLREDYRGTRNSRTARAHDGRKLGFGPRVRAGARGRRRAASRSVRAAPNCSRPSRRKRARPAVRKRTPTRSTSRIRHRSMRCSQRCANGKATPRS